MITTITKDAVTKMMNLLSLAALRKQLAAMTGRWSAFAQTVTEHLAGVLPTVFTILVSLVAALGWVQDWLDLSTTSMPLFQDGLDAQGVATSSVITTVPEAISRLVSRLRPWSRSATS